MIVDVDIFRCTKMSYVDFLIFYNLVLCVALKLAQMVKDCSRNSPCLNCKFVPFLSEHAKMWACCEYLHMGNE